MIYNSGRATAQYLLERNVKKAYVIGEQGILDELEFVGINTFKVIYH